jgi:hypothetical protein
MTTFITLAWHITKKDLRGSRDLIIMWVLLATVHTLLRTAWPPFTMSLDPDSLTWMNPFKNALPWMRTILVVVIVAHVVHADPFAGTQGFWRSRPISRSMLIASKLITLLLVVGLPAILALVAPMMAFGVPALDMARLLSEHLMYLAAGLMVTFVLAAITRNLRSMTAVIVAATAIAVFALPHVLGRPGAEARASRKEDPAVPLGNGLRFQDGPRSIVMWPLGDRDGQCGVLVRVTQVQGRQSKAAHPPPTYRFVYRPAGKGIFFTYFALPQRSRELAPGAMGIGTEEFELFQVLYRHVVVGPVIESNDPRDPDLESVSCRDVDVVVRR